MEEEVGVMCELCVQEDFGKGWKVALALVASVLHETGGAGADDYFHRGWDSAINEVEKEIAKFKDDQDKFIDIDLDELINNLRISADECGA